MSSTKDKLIAQLECDLLPRKKLRTYSVEKLQIMIDNMKAHDIIAEMATIAAKK